MSGVDEATVAVVGESPRLVEATALPTEMAPPPAVSAYDETSNAELARSSMSAPAWSPLAASVAATLGDRVVDAFGNVNGRASEAVTR